MTKNSDKSRVHSNRIEHRSLYEVSKDFGLPVIVLVVGLVVTLSQYKIEERRIERQENIEEKRIERQVNIEERRIERQVNIERERNQISILNNYRRSISNLIGTTNLKNIRSDARGNKSNYFHPVAVALTKSTLPQLDAIKKGNLITYLITLDLLRLEMNNGYAPITLADTSLRGANLKVADLRSANLSNADLRDTDLSNADLRGANLHRADLSNANLRKANLRRANLLSAILVDGDLSGADLRIADLRGTDLSNADLSNADLSGADLRATKGIIPLQLLKTKNWKDALLDNFIREATLKAEVDK